MHQIYIENEITALQHMLSKEKEVFILMDKNLKNHFPFIESYPCIEIESSECNKTFSSVEKITHALLEMGANRDAFLVGIGGGILTDLTGFTASIYKRGIRFAFVPTTLLAQVDASIGGKNGINFHTYKNILGTIQQPEWVFICPKILTTLPDTEFKAGSAELLKTFILFDKVYYHQAVAYFSNPDKMDPILCQMIEKCIHYKSDIVKQDAFERGKRRVLNLGHTFAHAIEKCTNGPGISHGYAVSMGLVFAARIADALNLSEAGFSSMLIRDLRNMGLPALLKEHPGTTHLSMDHVMDAIEKDKKVTNQYIHFILPKGLEQFEDRKMPLDALKNIAHDLR